MQNKNNKKWLRIKPIIQIFFFGLVLMITLNKLFIENGIIIPFLADASLHAICPFGGVASLYSYFTDGTFIQKIHISSLILMYAVFGLSLLLGPVFCGWVCPFGTFQEFISKLGRRILGKKFNTLIPQKLDKYLAYIRYFVLALVIYNTATTAKLMFQNIDPYYALFNFFTNEVALTAYVVLFITMALSMVVERPFCKYMCPYGATLGLFNFIRIFKIRRNDSSCINCKKCDKACPMNITVSDKMSVLDTRCISCMNCTSEQACPVDNTVTMSINKNHKGKVSSKSISAIIMVIIFATVFMTIVLGIWSTKSKKIPAVYKSGEAIGSYNPADIRGSYTFGEISELFNIPLNVLGDAFAIKDTNISAFSCSQLEALYPAIEEDSIEKEIGTNSVRIFVALYLNLPIELDETTFFPTSVEKELDSSGNLDVEEKKYIQSHVVNVEASVISELPTETAKPTEGSGAEINGKTTFKEALDLGINKSELDKIMGAEIVDLNISIRDYCTSKGVEFSTVKVQLQDALSK